MYFLHIRANGKASFNWFDKGNKVIFNTISYYAMKTFSLGNPAMPLIFRDKETKGNTMFYNS